MSMFLFFHTNEALVCTICITAVFGNPVPTSQYKYDVTLDNDGKYRVFWDFNETHITFEVHVQTKGYVGFGISPNGNMNASDVVIGWVKDGHTYFSVSHTSLYLMDPMSGIFPKMKNRIACICCSLFCTGYGI